MQYMGHGKAQAIWVNLARILLIDSRMCMMLIAMLCVSVLACFIN